MKAIKNIVFAASVIIFSASCGNNSGNVGHSTPIDSTNVNGTAPATYGPNDPSNDQKDSNRNNTNDTGTKANNIHREGNLPEEKNGGK